VALAVLLAAVAELGVTLIAPDQAHASMSGITGFNWADTRDNYASDNLVLSGMQPGFRPDDAATTAQAVAKGLAAVNPGRVTAIRMPVNPATTSDATWWPTYRAAIDAVIKNGQKVILGYWEANKDGVIDDQAAFDGMWDSVINAYGGNANVLFEPMNEPFGYSAGAWADTAATWLTRHPVDHARVIIDGTGYSENVVPVGNDSRLNGTILGLHIYPYWANRTRQQWLDALDAAVGSFRDRVVITEFGVTMTSGTVFSGPGQQATNDVFYLRAVSARIADWGLGSIFWPGLRSDDSFSATRRFGERGDISLQVINQSAIDLWRSGDRNTEATVYPNVYCYDRPDGTPNTARSHLTNAAVTPALGGGGKIEVTYLLTPEQWDSGKQTYVPDPSTSSAVRIALQPDISSELDTICLTFAHKKFGQRG
jgi:hypothetical protein